MILAIDDDSDRYDGLVQWLVRRGLAGNFTYLWAFDRRIALPDALPYPKVAA